MIPCWFRLNPKHFFLPNRFVSLDTLAMQEEEYIKNVTGRLLACQPNLVLVERTVSRLAQEILLSEGVSLALNVKFQVL